MLLPSEARVSQSHPMNVLCLVLTRSNTTCALKDVNETATLESCCWCTVTERKLDLLLYYYLSFVFQDIPGAESSFPTIWMFFSQLWVLPLFPLCIALWNNAVYQQHIKNTKKVQSACWHLKFEYTWGLKSSLKAYTYKLFYIVFLIWIYPFSWYWSLFYYIIIILLYFIIKLAICSYAKHFVHIMHELWSRN